MKKTVYAVAVALAVLATACGGNKDNSDSSDTSSSSEYSFSSDSYDSDGSSSESMGASSYDSESSSSSSSYSSSSEADKENADDLLKEYEQMVDKYITLAKKAMKGDVSALADYSEYMNDAESLSSRLESIKGELTAAQLSKFNKISQKMLNAAKTIKIDPSKVEKAMNAASKVSDIDVDDYADKATKAVSKYLGGDDDSDDDD